MVAMKPWTNWFWHIIESLWWEIESLLWVGLVLRGNIASKCGLRFNFGRREGFWGQICVILVVLGSCYQLGEGILCMYYHHFSWSHTFSLTSTQNTHKHPIIILLLHQMIWIHLKSCTINKFFFNSRNYTFWNFIQIQKSHLIRQYK